LRLLPAEEANAVVGTIAGRDAQAGAAIVAVRHISADAGDTQSRVEHSPTSALSEL